MGYENIMSCEGYDNDLRQILLHPGYADLSLWGDLCDHSAFPVGAQLMVEGPVVAVKAQSAAIISVGGQLV